MGLINLFKNRQKEYQIVSPLNGKIVPLEQVNDPVFSEGVLGKGIAIAPTEGKLVSPIKGNILTVCPTNHALGIRSEEGIELLIHIGIDTVELDGKFYKGHITEGDKVSVGDILVEFDIEEIKNAGYDITTMVIITNTDDYKIIKPEQDKDIKAGELLITVS